MLALHARFLPSLQNGLLVYILYTAKVKSGALCLAAS